MHRLWILGLAWALASCAGDSIEEVHPTDGSLHHPEGLCALGDQVHLVSSNHDRRYRSGALLSYSKASLVTGASPTSSLFALPAGFGGVLNMGACSQPQGESLGYLVLLDRVTRTMLRLEADASGALACPDTGCLPVALGGTDDQGVMTGIRDPGRAVAHQEHLLFSTRVDEQPTHYTADGTLERVGEAAASRPVVDGPWLIGKNRAAALRLTDEGAEDRLLYGFGGALWGVAGATAETGFALGRHGVMLIAFHDDGEALTSLWQQPLRNHRRRLVRAGDELLVFGGPERVLERRSATDGHLIGLVRGLSFEETEGAVSLGEGRLLVSNFTGHTLSLVDLNAGTTSDMVPAP